MNDIQELEIMFLDLVNFSSLRYLNICCEIFQLDSSNIQLDYPVSEWSNRLREYIYCKDIKKIPKNVKNSKGFCELMCSCFFSEKDNNNKKKKHQDLFSSNNLTSHVSLTKVSNVPRKDAKTDNHFSQQILIPNSKQNSSNVNFIQFEKQ